MKNTAPRDRCACAYSRALFTRLALLFALWFGLLFALLVFPGCAGSHLERLGDVDTGVVVPDWFTDADINGDSDVEKDVGIDIPPDLPELLPDLPPEVKKALGEPCVENGECEGSYCVEGYEGSICTETCDESCPEGFSCRVVLNYFPDVVSLCVPNVLKLCEPCQVDIHCFGGRCVHSAEGGFCAADCSLASCPHSFNCDDVILAGFDEPAQLCMPGNGSCLCREDTAGQLRSCRHLNEFGTCWGWEACDEEQGWIDCNAKIAEEESCNGVDDDCDALVDEGLSEAKPCDITVEGVGTCVGEAFCVGEDGWVCNAREPALEMCNFKDDDCDGFTDEDFRSDDKYTVFEHCGTCGQSCEDAIPHAETSICDGSLDFPACVVEACEPQYFQLNEFQCILPPDTFCRECLDGEDCFGNACLGLAGASYCFRPCVGDQDCLGVAGYACRVYDPLPGAPANIGERFCLPDNGTCDCDADSEGFKKACTTENVVGQCFGFLSCSAETGWSSCDAPVPALESCNGLDDDCNGIIDDGLSAEDVAPCQVTVDGVGTCSGENICYGSAGWICSAAQPELDICDYKDNDCDGLTDEDFRAADGGDDAAYDQMGHCGACNNSCEGIVANGTARCDASGEPPRCVVDQCAPGYYPFGDSACVRADDNSCKPCKVASDCIVPGDLCLQSPEGAYCALDCAEGNLHLLEAGSCAQGYTCLGDDDIPGVDPTGQHCRPSSGACTCMTEDADATRLCALENEFGTCYGEERCQPDSGWTSCDAATPAPECCNGVDDDCNGIPDDVPGLGEACARSVEGVGTCLGLLLCVEDDKDLVCSADDPAAERCDHMDNDCDGLTDEDFVDLFSSCAVGQGVCLRYGYVACAEGGEGSVCSAVPGEAELESCNNLDDDCDGETDEGWPDKGIPCTVGSGACAAFGLRVCDPTDASAATICWASPEEPGLEVCDGLDNDCDGETDEGFALGLPCTVGLGACAENGVSACDPMDTSAPTQCNVSPRPPQAEICDRLDNDCDGATDEGFVLGEPCSVGVGACTSAGVRICDPIDLTASTVCSAVAAAPTPEACNGLDDDCDGNTDENYLLGQVCFKGVGACRRNGVLVCDGDDPTGPTRCNVEAAAPSLEICDGIDNDCDGDIDQAWGELGAPCSLGVGSCLSFGVWTCDPTDASGAAVCDAQPSEANAEVCDGLDNDCDGAVDEEWPDKGAPCTVGQGACLAFGSLVCDSQDPAGALRCTAEPAVAEVERCDGVDNDCDGAYDEDWPDKGAVCTVGIGACVRANVRICDPLDALGPTICDASPGDPQPELCDGLDNNCNAQIDETWPEKGAICTLGVGECRVTGVRICDPQDTAGASVCDALPLDAVDESCDGLDNDCDGETDEDWEDKGDVCHVGVGACLVAGVRICDVDDPSLTTCDAEPTEPLLEICDGVDNDCDGSTDEDWPIKGSVCQVSAGACSASGTMVCDNADPSGPAVCNATAGDGGAEVCDGIDNDCDGLTDEEWTDKADICVLGLGMCRRTGVRVCNSGDPAGPTVCGAEAGVPALEVCDSLDNDCDGQTDEAWPDKNSICTVGTGTCRATGLKACDPVDNQGPTICDVEAGSATLEVCDGLDNNCDGHTDEAWTDKGTLCTLGTGLCARTGVKVCDGDDPGGLTICDIEPGAPDAEICDGLDNDCDGGTDEDWSGKGDVCVVGTGTCTASGTLGCDSAAPAGPLVCSVSPGESGAEVCDGLDNDCDGATDEDWPDRGTVCTAGTGACLTSGVRICDVLDPGGPTACSAEALQGTLELCDGLDNDCDGATDEDWPTKGTGCTLGIGVCLASGVLICDPEDAAGLAICSADVLTGVPEICDGLDNDCDGLTDEAWPSKGDICVVGDGICRATGTLICDDVDPAGPAVCSAAPFSDEDEICDGLDNDCDGLTDENWPSKGLICSVGEGTCRETGVFVCDLENPGSHTVCSALAGSDAPEVCDSLDNDCDGSTDEDWADKGTVCSVGEGACLATGVRVCDTSNPSAPTVCGAVAGASALEVCDGLDNDCDGQTDEAWPDKGTVCDLGIGLCRASGVRICDASEPSAPTVCDAEPAPGDVEVCDGLDNDCDALTDEGWPGKHTVCATGTGACYATGLWVCDETNPAGATVCDAVAGSDSPEICDGLDNDCDGQTDEAWPEKGSPCSVGLGACLAFGVQICDPSDPTAPLRCDAQAGDESAEVCDGVDNDCDGDFDEGWSDKGSICVVGQGVCVATGTRICDPLAPADPTICSVEAGSPLPEVCDGLDNNCNGQTDEAWSDKGQVCMVGEGLCERSGVLICDAQAPGGPTVCDAQAGAAVAETCDSLDNDCDGQTDEAWPELGEICVRGLGICQVTGVMVCDASAPSGPSVCSAQAGTNGTELCDGLDNDCDGQTDEDWLDKGDVCVVSAGACTANGTRVCDSADPAGPTICNATAGDGSDEICDGLDNDCDSLTDEEWLDKGDICTVGVGACVATGVRVCNTGAPEGPTVCGAVAGASEDEICDGLDNDCDSDTDEEWTDKGDICELGTGTCRATGVRRCDPEDRSAPTVCDAVVGEASQEICDGLDNDCNGVTDESWTDLGQPCTAGVGVCQTGGVRICDLSAPAGLTVCSATAGGPANEICDGLDNDCDTQTDEGWPDKGVVCSTGVGQCLTTGTLGCDASDPGGALVCSAVAGAAGAEVCDGLDNDCDAATDEAWPDKGAVCETGLGQCYATGTLGCDAANPGGALVCSAVAGAADPEVCDALDNDCDGTTDESWEAKGQVCEVGVGTCRATGTLGCDTTNPGGALVCSAQPGAVSAEVCDGLDNDCDGLTDEAWSDKGQVCEDGVGACHATGTLGCDDSNPGGALVCSAVAGVATDEICDGLDNDCDSGTDEDWAAKGEVCEVSTGVCHATGIYTCDALDPSGDLVCSAVPGAASAEVCDGLDNDCDGLTDEGWPDKNAVCTLGVGICRASGIKICDSASPSAPTVCDAVEGTAVAEACDALDNDCDGQTDELWPTKGGICLTGSGICERAGVYVCDVSSPYDEVICDAVPGTPDASESCNYLDDDCDGDTDEDFRNLGGAYATNQTCGSCFTDCTSIYNLPNAYGTCDDSGTPVCLMNCLSSYFDMNEVPDDGCEFFLDPDAIYVSTSDSGADNLPGCGRGPVGTGAGNRPCRSIDAGLEEAELSLRGKVLVADGLYEETVSVSNGVDLLGAYRADTWERRLDSSLTILRGNNGGTNKRTIIAASVTATTLLEGFVIYGQASFVAGGNSYALWIVNSTSALRVQNNVIYAGNGAAGASGAAGGDGVDGADGQPGQATIIQSSYQRDDCLDASNTPGNQGSPGDGGVTSCGGDVVSGGAGAGAECPNSTDLQPTGSDGDAAASGPGSGGSGGQGGHDRVSSDCGTFNTGGHSATGLPGANGGRGRDGSAGEGCAPGNAAGEVDGNEWSGVDGTDGDAILPTTHGGGGGGGGAGGGADVTQNCSGEDDCLGGSGGGGGAGACAGSPGLGGTPGGGSFAVFVSFTSPSSNLPQITDNAITRGDGGQGGDGGTAGVGGLGGEGADGGLATGQWDYAMGNGGRGGQGGDGGHGGGGGGACGGVSYGVFVHNHAATPSYHDDNAFLGGGSGGAGGTGGPSLGATGASGATGTAGDRNY